MRHGRVRCVADVSEGGDAAAWHMLALSMLLLLLPPAANRLFTLSTRCSSALFDITGTNHKVFRCLPEAQIVL
jgi:hypothetical protein